ncbi:MAG TPA: PIG-L family deacetylase [Edaphobacter sp.]|jgi:LmbE family N-acetylglucosaminyl deacetylase
MHQEPHLKILILSPHRDDAAFSLSIAITHWLTARHSVTILNVFTRSRYAPYSDAAFVHENDQLSYVSAIRLREDEHFLRRITETLPKGLKSNLHMLDLNLKDAPIRLRIPLEELSDTPINSADPSIEKVRKTLAKQSEIGAMEALVLPAALGKHVDHLTVREAAMPLTSTIPAAFYEDLPYATTHPSAATDLESLRESAEQRGEPLSAVVYRVDSALEYKRRLVLGYASQIDDEAGTLISDFATRYNGGERLWANQAWLEAFSTT